MPKSSKRTNVPDTPPMPQVGDKVKPGRSEMVFLVDFSDTLSSAFLVRASITGLAIRPLAAGSGNVAIRRNIAANRPQVVTRWEGGTSAIPTRPNWPHQQDLISKFFSCWQFSESKFWS